MQPAISLLLLSAAVCNSIESVVRDISFPAPISSCRLSTNKNTSSAPKPCSDFPLWINATRNGFKYAKAVPDATTHIKGDIDYLWSTIGTPSMVIGYTQTNSSEIRTNWTIREESDGANASIHLDRIEMKTDFSFGFMLTRIFTFNTSKLNLSCAGLPHGGLRRCNNITFEINDTDFDSAFQWKAYNDTQTLSDDAVGGQFNGSLSSEHFPPNATQKDKKGNIILPYAWLNIECAAGKKAGVQSAFPHLPFSGNSSLFDFQLKLVMSYTNISDESVALEIVVVPDPESGVKAPTFSKKRSIDDEYTPSIFYTYTGHLENKAHKGYMQWKPIAYVDPKKHTVEQSLQIYMEPDNGSLPFNGSLPYSAVAALYGDSASKSARVFYIILHPLAPKEFDNPTYFSWSLVLGYGTPKTQPPSLLVHLTVLLGLGIPLVLTLLSGVYVVYKKRQIKKMKSSEKFGVN